MKQTDRIMASHFGPFKVVNYRALMKHGIEDAKGSPILCLEELDNKMGCHLVAELLNAEWERRKSKPAQEDSSTIESRLAALEEWRKSMEDEQK